jgi:hypothetical protein
VKRHQLDLFSLIAGLAFVTVAVLYLLDAAGRLHMNGQLVIPLVLIALGAAGLAGALYRMARGSDPAPAPAPEADPEPAPLSAPSPSYRYDDLSPDLDALGLLDDPKEKR